MLKFPTDLERPGLAILAEAMGVSKRGIEMRAAAEQWPFETMSARGGQKRLYPLATLPADVAQAVRQHQVRQAMVVVDAQLPAAAPRAPLTVVDSRSPEQRYHEAPAHHKDTGTARSLITGRLAQIEWQYGCSQRAACQLMLDMARAGELPEPVMNLLRRAKTAKGRKGADDLPSLGTLQRLASAKKAGDCLVPKTSSLPDMQVKPWHPAAIALFARPQKTTLKWVHEQLCLQWKPSLGAQPPSYDQLVYFFDKKYSKHDALKGRHTGSALRARSFYQHRTYAGLAPFTEVHSDGWNTHFTAPHPVTGEYVTYEVWHFHDVATRYVTPFAIGLTENTDLILEGLQNCIRVGGVPAIWQTDHTGSVKNNRVTEPESGLADRIGMTVVHPKEVGNSQANGIAENFNTWLDREARELGTYQHPDRMDAATFVRTRRLTNAMVRAADRPADRAQLRQKAMRQAKGLIFDSHAEAVAWLHEREHRWNNHAHRSLPKMRDPASGRLVHMTPQQALDAAIAAGWQPVAMSEADLVDQFRLHVKKKVFRGCVTPYGGMRYRDSRLDSHEGEWVLVAVDREAMGSVWVKDLQGSLLCEAAFVEATGSRSQSLREFTERKRAEGQIRLRERQIDQINERINPPMLEMDTPTSLDKLLDDIAHHRVRVPSVQELRAADAEAARQMQEILDAQAKVVPIQSTEAWLREQLTDPETGEVDPMAKWALQQMRDQQMAAAQADAAETRLILAAMEKAAREAAGDDDFEVAAE